MAVMDNFGASMSRAATPPRGGGRTTARAGNDRAPGGMNGVRDVVGGIDGADAAVSEAATGCASTSGAVVGDEGVS